MARPVEAKPVEAKPVEAKPVEIAEEKTKPALKAKKRPVVDETILVGHRREGRRMTLAIGAGVAVLLLVGVVFAFVRSRDDTPVEKPPPSPIAASTPSTPRPPEENKPAEQPPAPPAEQPAAQPAAEDTAAEQPPAEDVKSDDTKKHSTEKKHADKSDDDAEPAQEDKKKGPFGGKKIVVEYDTQAREARPIPNASKDDQDAIQKAREHYATGNQRLFAGDPAGAIRSYKRALAAYPAYVAGYRGLGLAYAQKGDNEKALRALKTYLSSAPSAKDGPIIKKRISMLQGGK